VFLAIMLLTGLAIAIKIAERWSSIHLKGVYLYTLFI
jgi:hypothetical protein